MLDKLLLLDINGLLCCKVPKGQGLSIKSYDVILRPYYKEFLDWCYKHYKVGYFSSTSAINAKLILNYLLTPEQKEHCVLFWFRDKTQLDPYPKKRYDTIKSLIDVYDHVEYVFNDCNTLIIDDSYNKVRFNLQKNVLLCQPYKNDKDDDELIRLMSDIVTKYSLL
jgi:hypothetical protein